MKNRIKYLSKSSLSTVLALCMLLSCVYIGLIPTNAAYVDSEEKVAAVDDSEGVGALSVAGYIYFIKPDDWDNVSLMVGHSSYSCGYNMSNISGTSLYYVNQSAWNDSTEYAFIDASGWGGQNNKIEDRWGYAHNGNHSELNNTYVMNSGSTYLIPTTSNSPSYYSSGYSGLNNTLTIKTMYKSGSTYSETSTKRGTFSATGAKNISGNGTSAASSMSQTNATGTLSVARTNTATISQSAVSGYTFKGWKASADSTGSGLSTGNYSFTNSGSNTTIYAYYTVASTPAASAVSLAKSPSSGDIYTGETSVTYTATATSPVSGVTYNFKVDGTSVQNTSSNTFTKTFNSAGTYNVTVTVEKSGYDDVTSSAVSTTVVNRPDYYLLGLKNEYDWDIKDANKMTYNTSTGLYEITRNLYQGEAHYGGTDTGNSNDTGFKVYSGNTFYGSSSGYNINGMNYNNTTLSSSGTHNVCLTTKDLSSVTSNKVPYKFTYNTSNKKITVYYPMKVTFNMNNHGTAPNSQVVAYGGTATTPTAPTADGYTFGGWYKEAACTNAWNFSTDTVTADKTLYAKWTVNSHTITYPSTTTGYTLAGTKPTSADYNTTVSFTVTADTGYRIKSVKYTPNGGTATNCSTGSSGNEYHFTMPNANVTVTVEAVRQYTVTLTTSTKKIDNSSLSANAGFASRNYKIDNGTQKSYTQAFNVDAGSTVTFIITYNAGYGFNSVSNNVTDVNNSHQTFTVIVNEDKTVTLEAKELSRTVTVYKRLYTQNRASSTTVVAQTITDVGVVTSKTVNAADATADNGNYGFTEFSFDSNVITGSPNGRSAFSITTKNNATIYIDYDEVLYTLTINVSPQGKGSVKKGNTAYSSLQVGNVTGAVLTAVPIAGYQFSSWTQTGTPTTTAPSTATYNRIKIKGNTTLTANFEEITHTITLKKRYWLVEGDTRRQLDSGVDLGITFSGAGMYTPIEITAPKVRNCSFLEFDLNNSAATLVSGYELTNNPIEVTATADATIYVDYKVSGNIDIYVDMNDNVGTPILNIMYFADSNGNPVAYTSVDGNGNPVQPAGSTIAYLPYEMELVTGSESIYKYTLKVPKLREDYKIGKHIQNNVTILDLINISYITVENVKIGESSGFKIDPEAYATGEMWLKADSTKLTTFNTLSYGSVTNTFIGLFGDGDLNSNHTKLDSAIKSVNGTSIHTDDDEIYHAQYAGLYRVTKNNVTTLINNFHYTLNVSLNQEVTQNGTTYYFDKWIKCPTANLSAANGVYSFSSSSQIEGDPQSPDLNFTHALEYSAGDYVYIALYKPASNSEVRVEVTYNFKDFNSADGNYVYEADKTVPASYTKTIRVPVGTGQTYADLEAVEDSINTVVSGTNLPHIVSNYFDYNYKPNSAEVESSDSTENKIVVTAELTETARQYSITFKEGNNTTTYTGYYQQTKQLSTNLSKPVWKMVVFNSGGTSSDVIVGTGATFNAKFMTQGGASSSENNCTIIKALSGSGNETISPRSDVYNSFTEVYYDGSTEKLRHNFYIIDYCAEGKLVGGGVLYATTDLNGNYRQLGVSDKLDTSAHRLSYINGILGVDYSTEYKAQTINNIGFRYKPFKSTEDVFHYSDDLKAYLTIFEGSNVNSDNYDGQKLRLFSFMVYNNGTEQSPDYQIVTSDGYAEVDRYQPQSQS